VLKVLVVLKVLTVLTVPVWFALCFARDMGVDRFEDLIAWQLADQLQTEIFEFTSSPPASRDFKYCDQIRDSIRSANETLLKGSVVTTRRNSPGS
jgi:hypothetical protein